MSSSDHQETPLEPSRDGRKRRRMSYTDREFVTGVIATLKEYEQQSVIEPVVESSSVHMCLMGLMDRLPGKTLSLPCRKLWYAMVESSRQGSPDAKQFAGELIDELRDEYLSDDRLVISLEECSLILDCEPYVDFELRGLRILKFLAEQGKPFSAQQLATELFGSVKYVTTVREAIKKFEEQLNYLSKESGLRKRGRKPKQPQIKLIHSRTGYGYWFELPRR